MITHLPRDEFLSDYFQYRKGEHLLIVGPTGRAGKTHLGFQLLQAANHPDIKPVMFVMKPKDSTVARFTEDAGFKEIKEWPPKRRFWEETPPGYTLWPHQSLVDVDKDNDHLRSEFRKAMTQNYAQGNCILFLDEVYGITAELGLGTELNAILTRGRAMGCGAWMATQKPSGTTGMPLPGFVFNSPTHMFLSNDNDQRNRQRYADLAGNFRQADIENWVTSLNRYEFLYLHAGGDHCIVSA
jgi:hypothetical protein